MARGNPKIVNQLDEDVDIDETDAEVEAQEEKEDTETEIVSPVVGLIPSTRFVYPEYVPSQNDGITVLGQFAKSFSDADLLGKFMIGYACNLVKLFKEYQTYEGFEMWRAEYLPSYNPRTLRRYQQLATDLYNEPEKARNPEELQRVWQLLNFKPQKPKELSQAKTIRDTVKKLGGLFSEPDYAKFEELVDRSKNQIYFKKSPEAKNLCQACVALAKSINEFAEGFGVHFELLPKPVAPPPSFEEIDSGMKQPKRENLTEVKVPKKKQRAPKEQGRANVAHVEPLETPK